MENECVLILGSGYLGYNLAQHLKKMYSVTVVGLMNEYSKRLDKEIKFYNIDLASKNALSEFDLNNVTIINSVGGVNSLNRVGDISNELNHIRMICSLILSVNDRKVRKFIQLSSGGVIYGEPVFLPISEKSKLDPLNIYALSKTFLEHFLKINYLEKGLNYCIARVSNPYGGYKLSESQQGIIPIIINNALYDLPLKLWVTPENTRDYIYITDFVEAISILINSEITNDIVNVGSGIGVKLKDIISFVEKKTNKKIEVLPVKSNNVIVKNILNIDKLKSYGFKNKILITDGINLEIKRILQIHAVT